MLAKVSPARFDIPPYRLDNGIRIVELYKAPKDKVHNTTHRFARFGSTSQTPPMAADHISI
jgi:hypothetical protein